eukprot:CAMPEP_0194760404 /NCGR_PEP_ID=MMETSP0323_2-20130528/13317_1 /TAXON_ID=2866 ORGANISM="Crypthecodinium cohnii, Strain Seligo" /NCGR_SAMPLE_ID=MMETSP0323_2 /ASSEMBLY_ACC=CAM_ASM_000346 /LENGTH=41 /DNA_ID= /DNA_START= /DNA_END= /DNA_ORIENTATION=
MRVQGQLAMGNEGRPRQGPRVAVGGTMLSYPSSCGNLSASR